MRRSIGFWMVLVLAVSLVLPISLMAQTQKLYLESSSGDRIGGAPITAISSTPDMMVIYLGDAFTTGSLIPDIQLDDTQGSYSNCAVVKPSSVTATTGNKTISFRVFSGLQGAILNMPVDGNPDRDHPTSATFPTDAPGSGVFNWAINGLATGSYLAVFQAVAGADTSKLIVMIKITPPETITPPTGLSPLAATVNIAQNFIASGGGSDLGHSLQYRFKWGDQGTSETPTAWGGATQLHQYGSTGTYTVQVQAGCPTHSAESTWYSASVAVSNVAPVTVTLVLNPATGGTATVNGSAGPVQVSPNSSVQLVATPNTGAGYSFSGWSIGTSAPFSTATTTPYSVGSTSVTITANFNSSAPPPPPPSGHGSGTFTDPYKLDTLTSTGYSYYTSNTRAEFFLPSGKVYYEIDPSVYGSGKNFQFVLKGYNNASIQGVTLTIRNRSTGQDALREFYVSSGWTAIYDRADSTTISFSSYKFIMGINNAGGSANAAVYWWQY